LTGSVTLQIAADVRIVVPDSINVLTTYVLREQLDWFEDEIKFVRRLLQPGEQVIDIGANYGIYALTMAKMVGKSGTVWAFEPASMTAALLAQSINANGFNNVILDRSAISATTGMAQLGITNQSEFNALVRGAQSLLPTETVPVVSLDDCLARYRWKDIAFVKLDAEGEESNIISGAPRFLTECSPLILFEIKAGEGFHLSIVDEFGRFGFEAYRLVPGLNLLAPFDAYADPDPYLLNLFCCKPDRAAALSARGLLLDSTTINDYARADSLKEYYRAHRDEHTWTSTLVPMPYGESLASGWAAPALTREAADLEDALAYYAMSESTNLAPIVRFSALETSLNLLRSLCSAHPQFLRRISLARVAADFGARSDAVSALHLVLSLMSDGEITIQNEPFLAPAKRFDKIPIGESFSNWLIAACSESLEQLSAYSSFFASTPATLARLKLIASLGFASEEMLRRLSLMQARFGGPGLPAGGGAG
jgi:FkbM family methyltransferase